MPDTTTNLLLPYLLAAQAQKHVTHNEALRLLDGLVQLSVLDRDLSSPPGSPEDGDRYIVASGGTGDWAGWDLDVALRTDGAWMRLPPRTGWRAWVEDEELLLVFDGSDWVSLGGGGGTPGADGTDGASAYEIWLAAGNTGTEAEFLASLVGPEGPQGVEGPEGPQGPAGPAGADGVDGADGTSVTILGALATTGDLPGSGNAPGDGYIIAGDLHVWDGSQWNNVGPIQGPQGEPGPAGTDGEDGASAFQTWLDAGNTGTESEFLASLVGPEGQIGPEGPQGQAGADGVNGADGVDGSAFLWRGAWAAAAEYAENDVVENGGSAFICTAAHTATTADEPGVGGSWTASWTLFAAKGETGDLTAQGMIGTGPAVLSRRPVNVQAGSYTIALSDEGASVHMTGATAVTLTIPTNAAVALPVGAEIEIVALGAGTVTIAGDTGVSVNGMSAGSAEIAAQWQGAVLRKYSADEWLLLGAVGEVA